MLHTISVSGSQLAESLKDASCYASRDMHDQAISSIIVSRTDKSNQLSVVACDGNAYYERRIPIARLRKSSRKLPRLCISIQDSAMLAKFISSKITGNVTLEIDDVDGRNTVKVSLPNGASTTVFSNADLDLPDFSSMVARVEKARNVMPRLNDVYIPVYEMLRAGRVFPKTKMKAARMYTTNGKNRGLMAMLEYLSPEDELDIRVIFMLAEPVYEAA